MPCFVEYFCVKVELWCQIGTVGQFSMVIKTQSFSEFEHSNKTLNALLYLCKSPLNSQTGFSHNEKLVMKNATSHEPRDPCD